MSQRKIGLDLPPWWLLLPVSLAVVAVPIAVALVDDAPVAPLWLGWGLAIAIALAMVVPVVLRRRRQRAALAGQAMFRELADDSADIVFLCDERGACSYVSPSLTRLLGHSPAAFLGTAWLSFVHPEDLAKVAPGRDPGAASGSVRYRLRHREGHFITAIAARAERTPRRAEVGGVAGAAGLAEARADPEHAGREVATLAAQPGPALTVPAARLAACGAGDAGAGREVADLVGRAHLERVARRGRHALATGGDGPVRRAAPRRALDVVEARLSRPAIAEQRRAARRQRIPVELVDAHEVVAAIVALGQLDARADLVAGAARERAQALGGGGRVIDEPSSSRRVIASAYHAWVPAKAMHSLAGTPAKPTSQRASKAQRGRGRWRRSGPHAARSSRWRRGPPS